MRTTGPVKLLGVLLRTPDRRQGEFDKSPQAIWSPAGRAERERGQGAVGPAAIRPGAQLNQKFSTVAALVLSNIPGGLQYFHRSGVAFETAVGRIMIGRSQ
jgi:hypothetical protein